MAILNPPANFSVSRAADGLSAALTWDTVTSATEYVIYRAAGHRSTYSELTRVTDDGTASMSYTDNHGNENTLYSYKIATADSGGTIGKRVSAQHTSGLRTNL